MNSSALHCPTIFPQPTVKNVRLLEFPHKEQSTLQASGFQKKKKKKKKKNISNVILFSFFAIFSHSKKKKN